MPGGPHPETDKLNGIRFCPVWSKNRSTARVTISGAEPVALGNVDCDAIPELKGNPQAIKPGTEICRRGRNLNGDGHNLRTTKETEEEKV